MFSRGIYVKLDVSHTLYVVYYMYYYVEYIYIYTKMQ